MTKDEALRLALEALTVLLDEWTPARQAQLKGMDAITAVKAALLSRSDGEAKDEPVAWAFFFEDGEVSNELFDTREHGEKWLLSDDCLWAGSLKPLYTIQPQRKPLTDEEIQQIFIANSVVVDNGNAYMVAGLRTVNIARAIEAAHGIKDNT
jgi:hypothetical protein